MSDVTASKGKNLLATVVLEQDPADLLTYAQYEYKPNSYVSLKPV